jgi:hypothetical protein
MSGLQDLDIEIDPVAEDIEFDPSNCDAITSDNVQDAIDELCIAVANSASPGFTWGRSGNLPTDTWLLNDTVPSNRAGRIVMLSNVKITNIFIATEDIDTYDLTIYEHDGDEINLTALTTVSVVALRAAQFTVDISISQGKQLAARITNGSAKNMVAGCIIKGDS